MFIIYVIVLLLMILFKDQTKQLLEAVVKLVIAISEAIVNSIK